MRGCGSSTTRRRSCSRRSTTSRPGDDWYLHLQRSSVRFNSGGSGSFVSADGLVMTNHHVGADCLQKLSTKERDLIAQGFYAKTLRRGDPLRGPGAERPAEHRGRDGAGQRGGQAGDEPGRGEPGPPGGDEHRREGIARQDRAAQRRGHALPRRAVPPLPLQEVHRRPAGLRPGERTSPSSAATRTTSSIPATTSTSASSASTRTASRPRSSTT